MMLDNLNKAENKRVAKEYLVRQMNHEISLPHPVTRELLKNGDPRENWFRLTRNLSTSDLADLTAEVVQVIASQPLIPNHRGLLKFIQAENYLNQQIAVTGQSISCSTVLENGELPESRYTTNDATESAVIRHGSSLLISKELLRNKPLELAHLPQQIQNGALEKEADDTFLALENNNNLIDGAPLFSGAYTGSGNTLSDLFAIFRAAIKDSDPKHIVIPPSNEIAFKQAANQAGLSLTWHIRSDVTQAYLLANPIIKPTLVLLALNEFPVIDTINKLPLEVNAGLAIQVEHNYKIVPVARNGVSMVIQ